jgi:hypothetical protein
MKGDAYRDRMMQAAVQNRSEERELNRRIARLYEQAAEDMAQRAADSRSGSLTERFARDLSRSLRERSQELWAQVEDLTRAGMRGSARRAAEVQTSFLDEAGRLINPELPIRIRAAFSEVADEAVAHVLRGGIYGGKAPMLSKRIWDNAALQSGKLEEIISQAVAKGESPIKLSRALEAFVRPDAAEPSAWNDVYDIPFDYRIDYNAKRLAVTSIRHAAWGATIAAGMKNPYADFLHWELTPAHVIFDICDAHAAHDEGLGEGNFPLDAAPLPHPWCTCLWYVDTSKSLEQIGRELREWADGERSDTRLDEAFGAWKKDKLNLDELVLREDNSYFIMGRIPQQVVSGLETMRDDELIITHERIKHINKRHPGDLDKYGKHLSDVIKDPDFVLKDARRDQTGIWVKEYLDEDARLRITIKLAAFADAPHIKNSVLSFQYIRASEYRRLARKTDEMVYKRQSR